MAENEVGRVSLGVELSTDPLSSQAADLERKVTSIAEKAGKKFADEAAKAFEKNSDKFGEAGENAGEEAGKGAGKGLKSGSKKIDMETGEAGEKAGKSFFSRFQKNASGAGGGLKVLAGKIGKTLLAAFAAKKVFDFGNQAINLGSDLNEVQNVVDATFGQGSMAQKAVNDFAKNAATKFGLSETMAKRYAGTFGAMGKSFGFTDSQAAAMSTTLTGLAGDVASFYNITQDEAYTKLKSVFTGETESLKDLGVVMTQANLDQYALSRGLGTTTAHMSEQQKVALRYQYVLDKLSTASGDFSRTSGSWANQVRLLKLQFESLAATIGQVLIAALTPAIRALNSFMGVLVKAANTFKSFVFSLFGLESQDMGTGSAGALPDALGDISSGAGDAADSLGDVGDAATGAGKDAQAAANAIKRSLASFDKINKLSDSSSGSGGSGGSGESGSGGSGGSGGGSGAAGSLGDVSSALTNTAWEVAESNGPLDKIKEKFEALKELFMNGFWEGLGDLTVFDSILANIKSIGQNLKDIFTDADVVKAAKDMVDKLAENIGKVVGSIVSVGATIADNLTGGFNKFLEQHKEDIKNFIVSIFNVTGDIAEVIGDFAAAFADVFSIFRSDDAKQITADIISIFATGFGTVIETALKFARDVISNLTKPFTDNKDQIKQVLQDALGPISTVISSISDTVSTIGETVKKLYDDHIKPLLDSFGDGISDLVKTFLDGWTEHIQPVLEKLAEKFKVVFGDKVQPMIESVGEAVGSLFDVVKSLWESILQPLCKWIIDNIMPVLADLMEGLGDTLLDAIGLVADIIKDLADGFKTLADWIKDVVDAVGKLDFEAIKDYGKDIIDGLFKGIDDFFKDPLKFLKDHIVDPFVNAVKNLFGIHSPSTVMAEIGNDIINGLLNGIIELFKNPAQWVQDNILGPMADALGKAKLAVEVGLEKAKEWASDAWDLIKNTADSIKKTVSAAFEKVGTWAGDAWEAIKSGAGTIKKTVSAALEKAGTWAQDAWDLIKAGVQKIDNVVTTAVQKASTWVADAWNVIKNGAQTLKNTVTTELKKASTWASEAWDALKSAGQTLKSTVEQTLKAVKGDGWDKISSWATQIDQKLKAVKGDAWDKISGWATQISQKLKATKGDDWDYSTRSGWASQISQKLKAIKGDNWSKRKDWASQISQKLKATKGDNWSKRKDWASQISQKLKATKGDNWSKRKDWASQIDQKLKAVKGDGWSKIKDWAGEIKAKVSVSKKTPSVSWKKKSMGIVSIWVPTLEWKRQGGAFFNNFWKSIPQYASGGRPHGSMFVAGESGPEVVGHIGGRTEVLNQSQLASTMNAAVVNGMNAVSNNLASVLARTMSACTGAVVRDMSYYLPCLIDVGNGIRSDTAQLMAYARQAEAASGAGETAEVVTILKRILEILLAMDPDIYIDGQKITARIISIINAQTRATGKSAIVV